MYSYTCRERHIALRVYRPRDAPRDPRRRAREPAGPGGRPRGRGPGRPRRDLGRRRPRRVQSVAERGPADPAGPADEGDPREPRPGRPRRGDLSLQRTGGGRDPMDPDPAHARERRVSEGPGGPQPDYDAGGRRRHVPGEPAGRRRRRVPLDRGRCVGPEGGCAVRDPGPHAPADGPLLPVGAPGEPGVGGPAEGLGPACRLGPPRSDPPHLRDPPRALRHRRGRHRDQAERSPDGTRGPPLHGRVMRGDRAEIPDRLPQFFSTQRGRNRVRSPTGRTLSRKARYTHAAGALQFTFPEYRAIAMSSRPANAVYPPAKGRIRETSFSRFAWSAATPIPMSHAPIARAVRVVRVHGHDGAIMSGIAKRPTPKASIPAPCPTTSARIQIAAGDPRGGSPPGVRIWSHPMRSMTTGTPT